MDGAGGETGDGDGGGGGLVVTALGSILPRRGGSLVQSLSLHHMPDEIRHDFNACFDGLNQSDVDQTRLDSVVTKAFLVVYNYLRRAVQKNELPLVFEQPLMATFLQHRISMVQKFADLINNNPEPIRSTMLIINFKLYSHREVSGPTSFKTKY